MYFVVVFFLSDRPPPRSNRTYTLFPDTPLFRSLRRLASGAPLMPWRPADDHRPRPRPRRDPWLRRPRASQPRRGIADAGAGGRCRGRLSARGRSEEHTSELQSLMRISYAVFCLKKKKKKNHVLMR